MITSVIHFILNLGRLIKWEINNESLNTHRGLVRWVLIFNIYIYYLTYLIHIY